MAKAMVSVAAVVFASSIAARNVQLPITVPHTPLPGFASEPSKVELTVKVAAWAVPMRNKQTIDRMTKLNVDRLFRNIFLYTLKKLCLAVLSGISLRQ